MLQEEQKEKHYDEAMANVEREMAEDAEWKRIQENTFTRWTNEHLRQAGASINDLETDFSNGLKLIALLEVLSGKKMPRHNKKPTFRSQKLENVSIALNFLETEGVTLVNIDSTDITDCKLKLIMGLIWTLILHYSISMPMYDGPELGGHVEDKTPKQRLLGWMQNKVGLSGRIVDGGRACWLEMLDWLVSGALGGCVGGKVGWLLASMG